jgi:hypothetical protein
MLPLLAAISLEVGLVAYAILANAAVSVLCGGVLAAIFVGLWFVFPEVHRSHRLGAGASDGE